MRIAIPLGLALLFAAPARAESLRPPVDDAVWRVIDGAGGDAAERRIGMGAVALTSVATFAWTGLGLLNTFLLAQESTFTGGPPQAALSFVLMGSLPTVPVLFLLYGLERIGTGLDRAWWVGPLVLTLLNGLAFAAAGASFATPSTGPTSGLALGVLLTALAVAHVSTQVFVFGPVGTD